MPSPVTSIVVGFNHPVDATLVSAATIQLRAWPADDASLIDEAPIPTSFALPLGNPAAVLVLPLEPLPVGSYQLTVRGGASGSLGLVDIDAQSLGTDQTFVFSVDPKKP
jgi:hypothetical protein